MKHFFLFIFSLIIINQATGQIYKPGDFVKIGGEPALIRNSPKDTLYFKDITRLSQIYDFYGEMPANATIIRSSFYSGCVVEIFTKGDELPEKLKRVMMAMGKGKYNCGRGRL